MASPPNSAADVPGPFVVGVGASAGGLSALQELVEHLESDAMALIVVQHLAPEYQTMMDQILARHTDLAVELVENGVTVEPGHVYLIPPGKEMIMSQGRLLLTDRDRNENPNLPIDTFFRSLAQERREKAIAIVLSGTGRDGSRGIRAIHEAGGLTIAQTPDSAQFDSMPRAAIDTGCVDLELAPEGMGKALARFAQTTEGGASGETIEPARKDLHGILDTLRRRSGIDFRQYKDSTVMRRLQRRMALGRVDDVGDYAERIANDPDEADALYRDLLVGVTRFFRDADVWELLGEHIDGMVGRLDATSPDLRVWVAGCATGAEAYTMAILFGEAFRARKMEPRVKIFATDVHRKIVERASQGTFDEEALEGVPEELRQRWFREQRPGAYSVVPALREMVVFAHHDVTRDPPFTRLDLLSCRNLLIYLRPSAQQRVLTLFHFALKTSGLLLLGPSESPGKLADEFVSVDNRWKLFRKRRDVRLRGTLTTPGTGPRPARRSAVVQTTPAEQAHARLLARFAPPTILINPRGEVEHAFVGGGKFLAALDGDFSDRLLDLLDGGLRTAVSAATHRAWHKGERARYGGVRHPVDGEERLVDVVAEPVSPETGEQSSLLVSFIVHTEAAEAVPGPAPATDQLTTDRINALEDQLTLTKENLQAALEEMETSNEELQATNEELIASNEELQSTNEELSSVNEELVTVNAEYQDKIEELQTMTADLENLLASTEVEVLFLDAELRVRRFTPIAGRLFRLRERDEGRSVEDFQHRLESDTLIDEAREVLATGTPLTRDLSETDGEDRFLVRILPYCRGEEVTGVVLTFLDVTLLREVQRDRERLAAVVDATTDFVALSTPDGAVVALNRGGREMTGLGEDELPPTIDALHTDEAAEVLRGTAIPHALEHGAWIGDSTLRAGDGKPVPVSELIFRQDDEPGGEPLLSFVARDISGALAQARMLEEADRRKNLFLATLSHELRNPLHAIHTAVQLLERSGPDVLGRTLPVIARQTGNLERLLEDLLDVSRITAGQVHLRREHVVLERVLTLAVEGARTTHPQANIALEVEPDIELEADPGRLEQMVTNLLSNAAKYSPEGSAIRLTGTTEGPNVVIAVQDQGVGVSPDEQESIFEPFIRQADTSDAPGLGLGLPLVRQLAELHGGTVEVRSKGRGEGSTFVLTIPLEPVVPPPSSGRRLAPLANGEHRTILIVDDNEDALQLLAALLTDEGYEVHTADTLEAGREALTEVRPAVALVDIGLPDGSGLDLARAMQDASDRPALMVAISGYGTDGDIEASKHAGFDAHLVKPVALEHLHRVLGQPQGV